jgi:deoxyribodipyrimidine photo-lyase
VLTGILNTGSFFKFFHFLKMLKYFLQRTHSLENTHHLFSSITKKGISELRLLSSVTVKPSFEVKNLTPKCNLKIASKPQAPIIYWMLKYRRLKNNVSLAAAKQWALLENRPLLVVEGLSFNFPWVAQRFQAFMLQGVWERIENCAPGYLFVSPQPNLKTEDDFFEEILSQAAGVVTDFSPELNFPERLQNVQNFLNSKKIPFLIVDDLGVVPLMSHKKAEAAARFFRSKAMKFVEPSLMETKAIEEINKKFDENGKWHCEEIIFKENIQSFGILGNSTLENEEVFIQNILEKTNVNSKIPPVKTVLGGEKNCALKFENFLNEKLSLYSEDRSHPDNSCYSRMSSYLHYGMVHPRTLIQSILNKLKIENFAKVESLQPQKEEQNLTSNVLQAVTVYKYTDELIVWREIGFNMTWYACSQGKKLGDLSLVPEWAIKTLRTHMEPNALYTLEQLEEAKTADEIWNAAQRELVQTGLMQNYMRMVWGKGIVRWSSSPEEALKTMEHLNNKYALDGCDANSYTGFYWCLGKFDRPWPPARKPFGIVRSMKSESARKKLRMEKYLLTYSGKSTLF